MKRIIIILCLLVSFQAISSAKSEKQTGYLIVFKKDSKKIKIKTDLLVDVYTIAETILPENCIDFEKELKKSPFIEISTYDKYFYVEKVKLRIK